MDATPARWQSYAKQCSTSGPQLPSCQSHSPSMPGASRLPYSPSYLLAQPQAFISSSFHLAPELPARYWHMLHHTLPASGIRPSNTPKICGESQGCPLITSAIAFAGAQACLAMRPAHAGLHYCSTPCPWPAQAIWPASGDAPKLPSASLWSTLPRGCCLPCSPSRRSLCPHSGYAHDSLP